MARGNEIVVTVEPQGMFTEGYLGSGVAPKPGQLLQKDPTVALKGGRHTWKYQTPGADGGRPVGPLAVVLPNHLLGKTATDAYVAGDRVFLYIPQAGDELNVLLADVGGTADDHPLGEQGIIQNGTGKLIATTGTPGAIPFHLNEVVTDPLADTLAWVTYSGY